VRKWEFEVLGEELLDVWALDVVSLLEFNNLEDLDTVSCGHIGRVADIRGSTGNGIDGGQPYLGT
jgi:hypothetical protein